MLRREIEAAGGALQNVQHEDLVEFVFSMADSAADAFVGRLNDAGQGRISWGMSANPELRKAKAPPGECGAFKAAGSGRGRGGRLGCWGSAHVCNLRGRRIKLK